MLCALAAVAMGIISKPVSEGDMLAACALVAVISVPLGLAVGAVLPTDLEGTLVISGAVGVQRSLPQSSAANLALPLDAPIQFASLAGGFTGSAPGLMLLQATRYTAALILISILAGSRRVGRRRQVVIRAEGG